MCVSIRVWCCCCCAFLLLQAIVAVDFVNYIQQYSFFGRYNLLHGAAVMDVSHHGAVKICRHRLVRTPQARSTNSRRGSHGFLRRAHRSTSTDRRRKKQNRTINIQQRFDDRLTPTKKRKDLDMTPTRQKRGRKKEKKRKWNKRNKNRTGTRWPHRTLHRNNQIDIQTQNRQHHRRRSAQKRRSEK